MLVSLCFLIVIFVFLTMAVCVAHAENTGQLIVFSGRKEPLIKPVIQLFEQETGIKVVLKTGKSAALGQQIIQEMPNPSADIYIAKESGSLEYLRLKGVFEQYESQYTKAIPEKFKARDGSWIGVSGRSRALMFNTSLVGRWEVPKTLTDLTNPKWKGKIAAVNMGNESFVAWVSALRINLGDKNAQEFLKKLKVNDVQLLSKSHTDIRKAVGRGEYPMGLINHYYYHLQKHETDPVYRNVDVVYLDQLTGQRGELVNVSGAAIVKGAVHLEKARQFIDFLVSPEAQQLFAEVNFEYPLLPGVKTHPEVLEAIHCTEPSAIDCLNVMNVRLDQLGQEMDKTLELLENVNWH